MILSLSAVSAVEVNDTLNNEITSFDGGMSDLELNDEDILSADVPISDNLPTVEEGVVSGGIDLTLVHPWATTDPVNGNRGNITYDIPSTATDIKFAYVYVNIYSGSAATSYGSVADISIKDSPCWSLFLHGCEQVSVRGIRVSNPSWMLNSDGIDIDASRYVTISDCIIHTGDDAITLRACEGRLKNKNMHCEYVTITNCVLDTSICAFRIGVGVGTIKHARISNIVIERCCNAIQLCTSYSKSGKADIEDVNFSGISAYNTDRLIEAFAKNGAYVKNITIDNVRSTTCSISLSEAMPLSMKAEMAISVGIW